jgi:hypothetical protein
MKETTEEIHMKRYGIILKAFATVLCLAASSVASASTIYLAEINPDQSYGYIEGADPYQIAGTLKIIVDGATIRFENIDLVTAPIDVSSELIIPAVGNYDGLNFEYWENDPSLPVLGNSYHGTFDGSELFMQATTYNGTLYDFWLNSSSVSAVPLPGSLLLFSSGLFGLFLQLMRKTSINCAA